MGGGRWAAIAAVLAAAVPGGAAATVVVHAPPDVHVVDDTTDAVDEHPGDGECRTAGGACTLRAAVQESNASAARAEVRLPAGLFTLTLDGQGEDGSATGDLDVTGTVTVTGSGRATVVTSDVDRILHVQPGAGATVQRLTLRGASVDGNGGAVLHDGDLLTLREVLVRGNAAFGDGGGVFAGPGRLEVDRSTVAGNSAGNSGGGLAVTGPASVVQSTLSHNRAPAGGAVRALPGAALGISFSTLAGNGAADRGSSLAVDAGATASLGGSIVAGSGPAPDCDGRVRSAGANLASDASCGLGGPGDREGVEPRLGPLAWAGGPTPVHVPAVDSPAVDTVPTSFPYCPRRDQRGVDRPRDGDGDGVARCDRGAVER